MIESVNSKNVDEELFYDKSLIYTIKLDHYGVTLMKCKVTNTTIKIQKEPHSEFISVFFITDSNNKKVFEIYHCLHMDIDTVLKTITLYT